jgi:hypothetical protein
MNIYSRNIQDYEQKLLQLNSVLNRLSLIRLIAFVAAAIVIVILANERQLVLLLLAAPICLIAFSYLIYRFNRLDYLKQHTTFLKEINEAELSRQENSLWKFRTGENFLERDHPYASDLDIFGMHSVFQMFNRTTTYAGETIFANWLTSLATKETILARQEAVKELGPKLEWRQNFQASGMHFKLEKRDDEKLFDLLEKPQCVLPYRAAYLFVCILLSIISTSALVYAVVNFLLDPESIISLLPLVLSLYINSLVLKRVKTQAEEITADIHTNIKILGNYYSVMDKVESERFHSPLLSGLHSELKQANNSAAEKTRRLKKILETFQHRGIKKKSIGQNFFYTISNALWFLDVYLVISVEGWKSKNGSDLRKWTATVGEVETLSSVAGFHYSNPDYAFPEIEELPYQIHFEQLGHPLIRPQKRVKNSFNLSGRGEIAMITGSNMAGKSTFLRTVGLNLVLALIGAPCCASNGRVSCMNIFTSMRTQDNLEEGISSFYAELKRIEQLLKLIESGEPIFFLLDEMFKGTNSQDRYKGGVSLIKQLSELNAFGIISTHDLEMAEYAAKHLTLANYSFNSAINDGDMTFDYILTPGICTDFNASELMKKSGIKIL